MTWIFVVLFAIAYSGLLFLRISRKRSAKLAREVPGRVAPPLSAEELRTRIHRLAETHPEVEVDSAGEFLTVSWRLDPTAHDAHSHESRPEVTYALELQILDGAVLNVRYAVGTVHWQEDPLTPDSAIPDIHWDWPLDPVPGGEVVEEPWQNVVDGVTSPRSVRHLVDLVRRVALDAGYTWQPVLEMSPGIGTRQTERLAHHS